MNLIKLHRRENGSKMSFIVFAVLGIFITAFVSSSVTLRAPGVNASSEYGQYAVVWTITNIIGVLSAITLSMGSIEKHLNSGLVDILRVHGKSLDHQIRDIIAGDITINFVMGGMLLIGMIINILLQRPSLSIGGFFLAILVFLLMILISSLLMAIFNLLFHGPIAGLFGVSFIMVGALREIFRFLAQTTGGTFGRIMSGLLTLFPPLSICGEIERDLFFGSFTNYKGLISIFLYLWVLVGILYLFKKWRVRREK